MNAREEILHLMNRYSFAIDSGDLEGFAGLFEHGEWIIEGLEPLRGKQAVLDGMANVILHEDGTPKTKHLISNVDIHITDDGRSAKAQSYVTILQQTRDFPLQIISSGHYFDDFELVNGTWRFARRLVRNVLIGDARAHLKGPVSKPLPG